MKYLLQRFVLLTGIFLAGFAPRLSAQTLTTLFTNGPTSNRINIVLLAEGYQSIESNKFITDAISMAANLMSAPPYSEYTNYFNAYAIFTASTNSGANHTTSGFTNNTYFNSTYNSYGTPQLITIPPNDRDSNYNDGKGRVINLLTNLMPEYDIPILVVNDPIYGGSGNTPDTPNPLIIVSLSSYKATVVVHESGHMIGGLADEYTDPAPAQTNLIQRPNATTNTTTNLIPWMPWLNPDAPIPTPDNGAYTGMIGLWLGAQYHTNLWYRPTYGECIMNSIQYIGGFCPICTEAVTRGVYQKIQAVDSFAPATNNNNLALTSTNAVTFTATPLQPTTHNLSLQWFTNGVAAAGATNSTFTLLPQNFTNGSTNTVQIQTHDPTPLVRSDPNNYLSNSVSWNVTMRLSSLQLISPQWFAGGQFTFAVTGAAPFGFVVQASTNLFNWSPVSTNSLINGVFNYTNTPGLHLRFYRAVAN